MAVAAHGNSVFIRMCVPVLQHARIGGRGAHGVGALAAPYKIYGKLEINLNLCCFYMLTSSSSFCAVKCKCISNSCNLTFSYAD